MDIDRYHIRLGTRIIGILDTCIGLGVFIYQLYQMWEYYLSSVKKDDPISYPDEYGYSDNQVIVQNGTDEEPPNPFAEDANRKLPFYTFLIVCLVTFGINLGQAFMGFALQVSTYGRDQDASLRIATIWTKLSLLLLFILVLKCCVLLTGYLTKTFGGDWVDLGITAFEIIFRVFAIFWVAKFIAFLMWQAEFDCSTCSRPRPGAPRRR